MDFNKKILKHIIGIIAFTVILCALLINFGAVLNWLGFIWGICVPFAIGGAVAFVLNIPMTFFEKIFFQIFPASSKDGGKKHRVADKLARPVSLVLTFAFLVAVIAVVVMVVVPQLASTFESIGVAMTEFLPKAQNWLEEMFAGREEVVSFINSMELDWGKWLESIKDFAVNGAGSVLSYTMSATKMVVSTVVTFIISFIFSLYILLQKENLGRQLIKLIRALFPDKTVDRICYISRLSYVTFTKFITGQCLEALILGFMFFVIMSIFRFPYALLVGILIAFSALIPVVGAFVGCIVGAFLILIINPMQALAFVILFLVLQQVEGNLIYPHVVGSSVGLPSIWVLFAVTAGGKLMGVVGMLIFIPIMSVLYSLLRDWVNKRMLAKKNVKA